MKLTPREIEKLMLHNAGYLAQKRLARGMRLNYTEAVALIATQVFVFSEFWGFKFRKITFILIIQTARNIARMCFVFIFISF